MKQIYFLSKFLITIFSQDAIFIEKSFKDRFLLYRKFSGNKVVIDEPVLINDNKISTQSAFGKILDSYAKNDNEFWLSNGISS